MDPEQLIDVVQSLDPLSDLPRTGWLLRGDVPMPSKTPAVASAMRDLDAAIAREILTAEQLTLFEEVEDRSTLEARVVKAADKLQMMIKALTYEQQGRGRLSDFWVNPGNFADLGIAPAGAIFEAIARRAGRPVPGR